MPPPDSPAWAARTSPAMDALRLLYGTLAVAAQIARDTAAAHPPGACHCPYCSFGTLAGPTSLLADLPHLAHAIDQSAGAVAGDLTDPPTTDGLAAADALRALAALGDRVARHPRPDDAR